jgi:thioredoxin 2
MSDIEIDDRGVILSCPHCRKRNRLAFERLGQPARCGQCKSEIGSPSAPIEVRTSGEFDRLVSASPVPVVVDYWAPWCGPCQMVAPEVAKVATRLAGRALVVKVNTDELADVGQRFGIRSIPTLAVFSNGRELVRTTGARPAHEIEAFVEQAARSASSR